VNPWTEANTAQWPPGYTFLLAALYWLFGPNVAVAWGADIVLGALTCVAVYILGCLMLSQRAGAIAGILLAIFPGHVFFSSLLLSEILFTFLVVVAMVLILRVGQQGADSSMLSVILAGLAVGAAALVRGQGLLLIIVAALFWWLYTADWARALQWATIVMLTAVVVIIPWSIRNYIAMNSFVFISTNDGVNLYIGNNELAAGGFMFDVEWWIVEQYADLPPPEKEVAVSNAALREGLRFMFTHPGKELQLAGSKLRALYEEDGYGLRLSSAPEVGKPVRCIDLIGNVANGFYFTVLTVSAGGLLYWARRRRSAVALPLLVVGVFTAGQLIFFSVSRFHFPMLPSFCLLAAVGLAWGVEHTRSWAEARRIP
jgi:4-amino-4-deoxy-L-arabinose transferase-like glycosyltransferase